MIQVKGIRINALKPSYFVQTFTPPEKKDEKYWEKRGKNNIAARRFGTAFSRFAVQWQMNTKKNYVFICPRKMEVMLVQFVV